MFRTLVTAAALLALAAPALGQSDTMRFGGWNITNLHHESGVPLRDGAKARDDVDFDNLRQFAASLNLDFVALQEIGSPAALTRVFPESDYYLVMATDYVPGAENDPPEERDIYNAFAIRKSAFPTMPAIRTLDALHILHLEVQAGAASDRPVRSGLILPLTVAGLPGEILNVHLKSSCNSSSLDPVFDARQDGTINNNRYDCRTLVAQTAILENWIEQRQELGIKVIILGDFNRQLNRTGTPDHLWQMLEDGGPNGLQLSKAPTEPNTVCWPAPHTGFFPDSIDFITFDTSLATAVDVTKIKKVGIPFADDPRYAGKDNEKLSDHCPTVGELKLN